MVKIANFSLGWSEYPTHDWAVNVYFTGCEHRCAGCQNAALQDSDAGILYSADTLLEAVYQSCKENRTNKIVLLGGDPLFKKNLEATKLLLSKPDLEVCIYTGYDPDTVKKFIPDFGNLKYIKTGKFLKNQVRLAQKTERQLILASPNQNMFRVTNGELFSISENGIVGLEV